MNKPRQNHYDEYGYAVPPSQHDDGDGSGGTTLNAGFIATIAALSITAGMGTFFFIGGETHLPDFGINWGGAKTEAVASYGSSLDPVCGKDWRADLPNVDQMHCYLTRQVYRLCDEGEFAALIATIRQYDKDYKVWHRKVTLATFKTIGKMQTQGLQLGFEAAKLDNMKGSDAQKAEQFGKVIGIADNIMKPANDAMNERVNKIPIYELQNAAYALARKGYFSAKDFGRSKPDFIAAALKKAGKVKTACPNRG